MFLNQTGTEEFLAAADAITLNELLSQLHRLSAEQAAKIAIATTRILENPIDEQDRMRALVLLQKGAIEHVRKSGKFDTLLASQLLGEDPAQQTPVAPVKKEYTFSSIKHATERAIDLTKIVNDDRAERISDEQMNEYLSAMGYLQKNLSSEAYYKQQDLIKAAISEPTVIHMPKISEEKAVLLPELPGRVPSAAWDKKIIFKNPEQAADVIMNAEKKNVFYTDYHDALAYIRANVKDSDTYVANILANMSKASSSYDPRFSTFKNSSAPVMPQTEKSKNFQNGPKR